MPNVNVKTQSAKHTWSSPDGKIKGYEVVFDVDGKEFKANTYSNAISQVGWSGEVEAYEKNGRTYVRQPQKEDTPYQKSGSGRSAVSQDPYTMYLSYAKDLAVALQMTEGFDKKKFDVMVKNTAEGGKTLYANRPGAPSIDSDAEELAEKANEVLKEVETEELPV